MELDPRIGIRPGERWKQALQRANARCAVICLLSAQWERPHECRTEFRYAETLNNAIVCARLRPRDRLEMAALRPVWRRPGHRDQRR